MKLSKDDHNKEEDPNVLFRKKKCITMKRTEVEIDLENNLYPLASMKRCKFGTDYHYLNSRHQFSEEDLMSK